MASGFAAAPRQGPFRPARMPLDPWVPRWPRAAPPAASRAEEEEDGATVLVADAHEESRTVYGMLLRHAGYRVLEAASGEEVIRLAHAARPGAIVMAAVLQGVDGMRTLDVLKQDPATATVPVIVLSSFAGDEHERRARDAGCAAYLLKPCPPRRVLDAVRALPVPRQPA